MHMNRTSDDFAALEQLVDRYGLDDVVRALDNVCSCKETHLLEAWGPENKPAAQAWRRDAGKLDRLAARLEN